MIRDVEFLRLSDPKERFVSLILMFIISLLICAVMLVVGFYWQLFDTFTELLISGMVAANLVIYVMETDKFFIFVFRNIAFIKIDLILLVDSVR